MKIEEKSAGDNWVLGFNCRFDFVVKMLVATTGLRVVGGRGG